MLALKGYCKSGVSKINQTGWSPLPFPFSLEDEEVVVVVVVVLDPGEGQKITCIADMQNQGNHTK